MITTASMVSIAGITYIAGILSGVGLVTIVFGIFQKTINKKAVEHQTNQTDQTDLKKKQDEIINKQTMAQKHFKRAREIAIRQEEIQSLLDRPSQNALHSKYKNDLVREFKGLEEEKFKELTMIVDNGFNPPVDITDENGKPQRISLKEYINVLRGAGAVWHGSNDAQPPQTIDDTDITQKDTKNGTWTVYSNKKKTIH